MSCRRAFEVDVADFLAHSTAVEFAEFRDHYPACPDCASEVRAWTELDLALRAPDRHPMPDRLFRFVERREGLGAAEAAAVQQHLRGCASCRDEVTALGRFDFDTLLGRPRPAHRAWRLPAFSSSPFGRLVLHPAFAYAIVLVLLYPALSGRLGSRSTAPALRDEAAPVPTREEPLGRANEEAEQKGAARQKEKDEGRLRDDVRSRLDGLGYVGGAAPAAPPAGASGGAPAPGAKLGAERAMRLEAEEPLAKQAPAAGTEKRPASTIVTLDTDATATVSTASAADIVVVRVPVSSALRGAPLDLRLLDADGRRELRERFARASGAHVETRVPRSWLTPGTYRIELSAPDMRPSPDVFALRVE